MGLAGDGEETIFKKYQTLCNDLNMDKDAANKAWNSYETIMQNYSLEVSKVLYSYLVAYF